MSTIRFGRRDALKGAAAGAAAGTLGPFLKAGAKAKPNIIFILTDDHRWDAFGFMDKPWLQTPHMDRLAKEGVHFENSFVTTSLCSPSRASFLTGQYARCHGVQNNLTPWRESNLTFLEVLHSQGYRTAFIGKWHMPGTNGLPDMVGQGKLDRMVSFTIGTGQGIYYDCPMVVDGKKTKTKGYITDVLTDYSLDFLSKNKDKPFCMYLSHKAVHHNFTPPERYDGALDHVSFHRMEDNEKDLPMGLVHVPQRLNFEKNQQHYYEALMGVDDSLGRLLKFLDDNGLAENTLIVYAGDNGYFWGEHGLIDKRYAYEESLRIPQLMRFPRLVPDGGKKVDEMVLNIDLAPTLLAAAGIQPPSRIQGRSCLELSQGKDVQWRDSFLYEYFDDLGFPHPPIRAVRTPEFKYINYLEDRFKDELFNIKEDPGERNNLIDDHQAAPKLKQLKAELERLEKKFSC